jgi:MFS family permease
MKTELRALVEVFRSPELRRLELAWLATSAGVWGAALVLAVYAFDRGGATAVGVMALIRTLPGAPLAPLLTYLADRLPRRSVLLATNAVRALILGAIATGIAADAPLAAIYALVALFAIASPAYKPSQSALFPVMARTPSELGSANVAATMLTNLGFLAGSLAGGVLLTVLSFAAVVGVLAGSFALSLLPLLRLAHVPAPPPDPDARPIGELVEGFQTVWRDPELLLLVFMGGLMMLTLGAIDVLVVVSALGFLDIGETGAGYLSAGLGVGAVAGGLALMPLLGRGRLTTALVLGGVMTGIAGLLSGLVGVLVVVALALVLLGAGDAFGDTAVSTLLQRLTPDHVLSRVFGVVETLSVVVLAVGALATGFLVDAIGARPTFIVIGALMPLGLILFRSRLAAYEAASEVPVREYGLLRAHSIFAPLPVATAERLARGLEELRPDDGTEVIRQGEPGKRFYLVAEGRLEAVIDGAVVRTMGTGDGFGEIALLRDVPRTATVRAVSGVVLLALDREDFIAGVTGLQRSARAADHIAAERLATTPATAASAA